MAKESKTKYVLLGLLKHENLTGYDMKQIIQRRLSYFWNESFGQIYPQLSKLLADGYITKATSKSGRAGKEMYKITARGKKMLQEWLIKPADTELVRSEGLLKIFFGGEAGPENTLSKLNVLKNQYKQRLELMDKSVDTLKSGFNNSVDHHYFYLVALLGKMSAQTYLEWIDIASTHLKKLSKKTD